MKACDPIPTNATAATTRIVMRMMLRPFSKSKFVIQKPLIRTYPRVRRLQAAASRVKHEFTRAIGDLAGCTGCSDSGFEQQTLS